MNYHIVTLKETHIRHEHLTKFTFAYPDDMKWFEALDTFMEDYFGPDHSRKTGSYTWEEMGGFGHANVNDHSELAEEEYNVLSEYLMDVSNSVVNEE